MRQFSQACENNKGPILTVLREIFTAPGMVLEIGSGTGQHAIYMAEHLPHLTWQPSDLPDGLASVRSWLEDARLPNVLDPLVLDVTRQPWPVQQTDGVFSANTGHIMSWPEVEAMIKGVADVLVPGGAFCLYGPFNYKGRYTSDSNKRFDQYLKATDPRQGVRDFVDLESAASDAGLTFYKDYDMPANNRILVWRKAEK